MVRPPEDFLEAAENYVCVRIININEIDLSIYPFDFDLTMAILLANADGTTYHRYGGRHHLSPMSMEGLVDMMRKGRETHLAYMQHPSPPEKREPELLPELVNERLKGIMPSYTGCFHCHYAREAKQLLSLKHGDWTPDKFWIFPQTDRLGIVMDQTKQYLVEEVMADSPAAFSGIEAGDLLQTLAKKRVLSKYDIQWVLDQSEGGAVEIPYSLLRDGKKISGHFTLLPDWKVGDPKDYSWRVENPFTAHMIKFLPTPGFTGDRLGTDELRHLKLREDQFALRVTKLNYGPYQAGIRVGDVILGASDKSEFGSTRDFYAWCEELRRAGRDIKIQVRREGEEMAMMVSLNYLNYSRMEKAPRVDAGFISQQLPGDEGVRVGHVTKDSSAENAGILLGDRIVQIDSEPIPSREKLLSLLEQKTPGNLVLFDLLRNGTPLQLSFYLSVENQARSDAAWLQEKVTHPGQQLSCTILINLPPDRHIYSTYKKGTGLPTRVDFRGSGYRLIGGLTEPDSTLTDLGDWILEGRVELRQRIEITDPRRFQMILGVSAQVCDDRSCHQFRAVVASDGDESFFDYHGDFGRQPEVVPVNNP